MRSFRMTNGTTFVGTTMDQTNYLPKIGIEYFLCIITFKYKRTYIYACINIEGNKIDYIIVNISQQIVKLDNCDIYLFNIQVIGRVHILETEELVMKIRFMKKYARTVSEISNL